MTFKNIFLASCPGTASNSLRNSIENSLGIKSISLKYGGGFHHTSIRKPNFSKKLLFLLRKKFKEKNLFHQHFFPTKQNIDLLENYIGKDINFIVIYRNIYEIVNYFYKWSHQKKRGPLSMIYNKQGINYSDIDLNIVLALQFFKLWFIRKKENKLKIKFVNFNDIISKKKNLKNYLKKNISNRFDFLEPVNLSKINRNFKIPRYQKDLILNFKRSNKMINFKLIGL